MQAWLYRLFSQLELESQNTPRLLLSVPKTCVRVADDALNCASYHTNMERELHVARS